MGTYKSRNLPNFSRHKALPKSTKARFTIEHFLYKYYYIKRAICLDSEKSIIRNLSSERQARRKPLLLLRLSGLLLLRFETRQFLALLFQLPPRSTRLEPPSDCHLCHYRATKIVCRGLVYKGIKGCNVLCILLLIPQTER